MYRTWTGSCSVAVLFIYCVEFLGFDVVMLFAYWRYVERSKYTYHLYCTRMKSCRRRLSFSLQWLWILLSYEMLFCLHFFTVEIKCYVPRNFDDFLQDYRVLSQKKPSSHAEGVICFSILKLFKIQKFRELNDVPSFKISCFLAKLN